MNFLEKDLEEIIFSADKDQLLERGLGIFGKLFRQLRIGNYGIADLVSVQRDDDELSIDVIELKKDKIGVSAFFQAVSYVKGISRYLDKRKPYLKVRYNIVLIGSGIDTSGALCYLTDLISNRDLWMINNISFYTYSYKIDGIEFDNRRGFALTDEGF